MGDSADDLEAQNLKAEKTSKAKSKLDDEHKLEQDFFRACKLGDCDLIRSLADQGFNVNSQQTVKLDRDDPHGSHGGNYPIHLACQGGKIEAVKLLHGLTADIEAENSIRSRPLHTACVHGHLDVVKFLLASKAQVSSKNKIQNTPLHVAVYAGHLEVVKALLETGEADVNDRNLVNVTPYMSAHSSEMVALLEPHKAADPVEAHLMALSTDLSSVDNIDPIPAPAASPKVRSKSPPAPGDDVAIEIESAESAESEVPTVEDA